MSYATNTTTGTTSGKKPQRKTKQTKRSPSASEIAKNKAHFETWSHHQNLEQTSYNDVPQDLKVDVDSVFNLSSKIPLCWVDKNSNQYELLRQIATPGLLDFVYRVYESNKKLFTKGNDNKHITDAELFTDLALVYSAWEGLRRMLDANKESWSEADYVANVYTIIRRAGIKESSPRNQCRVCLPRPVILDKMGSEASRILQARMVIPDCAVFIPHDLVKDLSESENSIFKKLNKDKNIRRIGAPTKSSSFAYQATPSLTAPEPRRFEFACSFSEDKKPSHQMLEDAYRQNRMSTASAVRHLHSLHINSPVFGLVWSHTTVRAHVDWWRISEDKESAVTVYSAAYPTPGKPHKEKEWVLTEPSDLLEIYFLLRNIDHFTTGRFAERVTEGVQQLLTAVKDGKTFSPWRRSTESPVPPSRSQKENISSSSGSSPGSSPRDSKRRSRKKRTSK